jgi:hypothetical protein
MPHEFTIALYVSLPVSIILYSAVFVWYLNIVGIYIYHRQKSDGGLAER